MLLPIVWIVGAAAAASAELSSADAPSGAARAAGAASSSSQSRISGQVASVGSVTAKAAWSGEAITERCEWRLTPGLVTFFTKNSSVGHPM